MAVLAAVLLATPGPAQPGTDPILSAEGRIEDDDSRDSEQHPFDDHRVRLEAGQRYRLFASSADFDTVIRLFQPGSDSPVAENDDFGEGLNSRITYTAEVGGDYRLRVRPFSAEGRGAYTVGAEALAPLPPAAEVPSGEGWSVRGRIEAGEEGRAEERFVEHRLRLEGGRRYRLSASSEDFDTMLELSREDESEPVAQNDDHGGSLNSRITFAPEQTAVYVLRVRPLAPDTGGAFTLGAELLPPLPPPITQPAATQAGMQWQIWEGELTESDPDRDGAHFDDYLVPMRAGEVRLISVEAADFDTVAWVLRADAREGDPLDQNDDAGPGLNALLAFQPTESGDHVIRVTAYGSGGTGPYRLRVSEPLTPPPPAPTDAPDAETID
ncbi:PPC domain-containing protein [Sphingosinicella sp. CPCC 101087]|uniref:PPC domain-containing protein n=1 Tax=Sphingosinicella sp. CPCC 101087 TaxID=2497754 RepID=UPI00197F25A2|nr:PPC domain-containing protein [Sphingosinicella sp. CPCC 101087]